MALIGISGYAKSGKDTVGKMIQILMCKAKVTSIDELVDNYEEYQWWLEEQSMWEIRKYAGKLKEIASLLTGVPVEKFEDQEFKNTYLGDEWKVQGVQMKVREFLQYLGTNALRDCLHANTWVNALFADYNSKVDDWIITDVRFPNEAKAIKDRGGLMIRVDRPGVKPINNHPSETALDDYQFDYKIGNVSDLVSLMFTVETILKKEKLLL